MSKILKIEDISTDRLRKMLGSVKRALNTKMGAISKMKKPELLNKITELQYKWDVDKQQLTTNSMIRKKSVVQLPPMKIRVRTVKPLTKEKKVKLLKKMVSDFEKKKKAETKKAEPKKAEPKKKIFKGFGELPNFMKTDNFSIFKNAWEQRGFKVEKA